MEGYPDLFRPGSPDPGDLVFYKQANFQFIPHSERYKSEFCFSRSLPDTLAVCLVVGARNIDLIWFRRGTAEDFCADPIVEDFFPSSLEISICSFICRVIWSGPYLSGTRRDHPGCDLWLCNWILLSLVWPGHSDDHSPLPAFCFPICPDVFLVKPLKCCSSAPTGADYAPNRSRSG